MVDDQGANNNSRRVSAVDTSLDILEILTTEGSMTVTEIAEAIDQSPSSVHAHLVTLESRGYVVKENHEYRPGLRYFEIGETVKNTHIPIYQHGTEQADQLAQKIDEYVWLMVEEHGSAVYVYKTGTEQAVETGAYTLGSRWPLHTTAAGKVILACMEPDEREAVLESSDLLSITANTITEIDELLKQLESIRDRGVAFDDEEAAMGLRAVAAPVNGFESPIGAISVSGPVSRIDGERFRTELPQRLREAANIISVNYRGATIDSEFEE